MGWGNQAGTDGVARNHLAPAAELLAGKAWESLRFFGRLLSPELDPRFVWRAVESAAVPLAIAVVGTMLGVVAAILLTYPHSASFQLLSERFSGESAPGRSEEHTSELQSLMRISYAVFCLKKQTS